VDEPALSLRSTIDTASNNTNITPRCRIWFHFSLVDVLFHLALRETQHLLRQPEGHSPNSASLWQIIASICHGAPLTKGTALLTQ
jgi:hypothetical protein